MSDEPRYAPSRRRIEKARRAGRVARSNEIGFAAVLLTVAATVTASTPALVAEWRGYLARSVPGGVAQHEPLDALQSAVDLVAAFSIPVFLGATLAATAITIGQVGLAFSVEAVLPDARRLAPSAGLRRLLSMDRLGHFFSLSARLLLWTTLAYFAVREALGTTLRTMGPHQRGATALVSSVGTAVWWFALAASLVGVADWLHRRRRLARELRMSRQDQLAERRESEANPATRDAAQRVHGTALQSKSWER